MISYLQAAWPSFLSIVENTPDAKRGPKKWLAAAPQLKYASLKPSSSRLYLGHTEMSNDISGNRILVHTPSRKHEHHTRSIPCFHEAKDETAY